MGIRRALGVPMPSAMPEIHILVVDDDPAVNAYVCGVLRKAGYQVEPAADLAEAAALAREKPLDVLVSDVVLGPVDGLDVEEAVRVIRPAVKTIFMSGYAKPRYRSGDDDPVLVKPFEPAELLARVESLVGDSRL